ncbi:MAG: helix-turn-helix domain-containing protein [Lachnospiraceae bacterium]|nr:helix-turn-helix domain-containing protein [Lachnospiraceae bacterium]
MKKDETVYKRKKTEHGVLIGKRLKQLRDEKDITQEELVKDLQKIIGKTYSRSTIAGWERGFIPNHNILKKLAEYYDVQEEFLLPVDKNVIMSANDPDFTPLDIDKLHFLSGQPVFAKAKSNSNADILTGQWGIVDLEFERIIFSKDTSISFDDIFGKYDLFYRPVPGTAAGKEKILNKNEIRNIKEVFVQLISPLEQVRNMSDNGIFNEKENAIDLNNGTRVIMNNYGKGFVCYKEKPLNENNECIVSNI